MAPPSSSPPHAAWLGAPGAPALAALESKRCFAHRSSVTAVGWNADGSRLLAAGDASAVYTFSTERLAASTYPETRWVDEFRAHTKKITAVAASPSAPPLFASTGLDGFLHVYDARASGPAAAHSVPLAQGPGADGRARAMCWAPDGNAVAVALDVNAIVVVDSLTWGVRRRVSLAPDVNDVAVTSDGRRLVVACADGSLEVREWPSMRACTVVRSHAAGIASVAADPKGRRLASAGLDAAVAVTEAQSFVTEFTIDRWDAPITAVAYSHDGRLLAAGGDMDSIDITDAECGSHLHSVNTSAFVKCLAWHPSRLLLAYATMKRDRERYSSPDSGPPVNVWGFPRSK